MKKHLDHDSLPSLGMDKKSLLFTHPAARAFGSATVTFTTFQSCAAHIPALTPIAEN